MEKRTGFVRLDEQCLESVHRVCVQGAERIADVPKIDRDDLKMRVGSGQEIAKILQRFSQRLGVSLEYVVDRADQNADILGNRDFDVLLEIMLGQIGLIGLRGCGGVFDAHAAQRRVAGEIGKTDPPSYNAQFD